MSAFIKGRTTIAQRIEKVPALEFPTILICFDPATKLSVTKKYGFVNKNDIFKKNVKNSTLSEVFDNVTFLLNRDVQIKNYNGEILKEGLNIIQEYHGNEKSLHFNLEHIRTFTFGTCQKLEPKFEVTSAPIRIRISIILNQSIDVTDMPESFDLLFLSNQTWLGILDSIWPQIVPQRFKVEFKKEYTTFLLKTTDQYFQSDKKDIEHCVIYFFQKRNCSYLCNILSFPKLPPCQTAEHNSCMTKGLWDEEEYLDCYKTDKVTSYALHDRMETPLYSDRNVYETEIFIGIFTMEKVIKEEVLVLTLPDLIGSIGGSLGMFFGFSMSTSIFYWLNKMFNKLF